MEGETLSGPAAFLVLSFLKSLFTSLSLIERESDVSGEVSGVGEWDTVGEGDVEV